ncbi:MAG TPA: ATP-binding protein [Deferrisomatales bacterium]|nr:ATP-binding protein [Deferrisomatales bacterium]
MDEARRVLYIEDTPANFNIVARLLRAEGFEVLHAEDGFTGVETAIAEKDRLDLILMDINMPGMDGYEAATKLKAIQGFDTIPIIAVTVNTLQGDRMRSLAAGCDGYIPKPIDVKTFPARVQEYIRGRRDPIHAADERYYLREHARKLVDQLQSSIGQLKLNHEQIHHQDKLASLGEMAASLAHELNNPLSSIAFAIHQLLRHTPEDERQRNHLELIERNVERIRRLAEGLTSFARPSEVERYPVDLLPALEQVLVLSEHEFRSRNIQVEKSLSGEIPPVWANESQLQHVFLNLLRNSAHAIGTRAGQDGQTPGVLQLEVTCGGLDRVCVRITDNGCGISPEFQDRLFKPFFTTKARGEGTGLGLYIVKEIIAALDGRIELCSTVGVGTTFTVHLPRATASQLPPVAATVLG